MTDLTTEQISAIANAIVAATPRKPRDRHSWVAVSALVVTVLGLMGVGFGAWVSSSNALASQGVRINGLYETVVKNGNRIDRLEQAPPPSTISPVQLQDLKDDFTEFRSQYKEDTRDLKLQIQTLQDRKR